MAEKAKKECSYLPFIEISAVMEVVEFWGRQVGHLISSKVDLRKVVLEVIMSKLRLEELMVITKVEKEDKRHDRSRGEACPRAGEEGGMLGGEQQLPNKSFISSAEMGLFPWGQCGVSGS